MDLGQNRTKKVNYLITVFTQIALVIIALYTTYQSVSEIGFYRKELQQLRGQVDNLLKENSKVNYSKTKANQTQSLKNDTPYAPLPRQK